MRQKSKDKKLSTHFSLPPHQHPVIHESRVSKFPPHVFHFINNFFDIQHNLKKAREKEKLYYSQNPFKYWKIFFQFIGEIFPLSHSQQFFFLFAIKIQSRHRNIFHHFTRQKFVLTRSSHETLMLKHQKICSQPERDYFSFRFLQYVLHQLTVRYRNNTSHKYQIHADTASGEKKIRGWSSSSSSEEIVKISWHLFSCRNVEKVA